MNEKNKEEKQEAAACGPGCSCGTTGSGGRWRWIVGVVVLLVTGLLVARAMMKDNGAQAAPASTGFAALPAPMQTPAPESAPVVKPPVTDAVKEIAALSELNGVAADSFGVFVFLPGKGETATNAPIAQMRGAARTIEPQLRGGKIGLFALKAGSRDYEQVASQMAVPGVLAMVKGKGMSATSGDITETKLVQALVTASSAGGGCGPSSAGCGPGASGCN